MEFRSEKAIVVDFARIPEGSKTRFLANRTTSSGSKAQLPGQLIALTGIGFQLDRLIAVAELAVISEF